MRSSGAPSRRVRIDRLELDLRGITPATAEAAVRALGPALAAALASHHGQMVSTERVEAGRLTSEAAIGPRDLAAQIADRIGSAARGETP